METTKVKQLIEIGLPNATVTVTGDGDHFDALVISESFVGQSMIKQQRMVMATVNEQILSGELHALSIKTEIPS
jgi:acid stress-induced BolA-like protein IbaG/YrbA